MTDQPNSCATCTYYNPIQESPPIGYCRRYPPKSGQGFPQMPACEWCGEHTALKAGGRMVWKQMEPRSYIKGLKGLNGEEDKIEVTAFPPRWGWVDEDSI